MNMRFKAIFSKKYFSEYIWLNYQPFFVCLLDFQLSLKAKMMFFFSGFQQMILKTLGPDT